MFEETFLKELPEDNWEAAKIVSDNFLEWHTNFENDSKRLKYFDKYIQALAFGEVFADARKISFSRREINYAIGESPKNIGIIVSFFRELDNTAKTELTRRALLKDFVEAKNRYASVIGKAVVYEFADDDFKRVQDLINELRKLITKSSDFDENHKRRLLRRLEKLQGELHKKMSNLDMQWGLIGDAGVALGKFGENAKPFVDRIGEILQIVGRTQAMAENIGKELPFPLLGEGDKDSEKKESW